MEECYCIKVWKDLNVIICRMLIVWKKYGRILISKKQSRMKMLQNYVRLGLLEKYGKYY